MAWQAKTTASGQPNPVAKTGAPTGTRRYFAYSAALDPDFRARWRSERGQSLPQLSGVPAELKGHQLVYRVHHPKWGGKIAGLEAGPGSVHGLSFEVAAADWPLIEALEGSFDARPVEVEVRLKGQLVKATTFIPAGSARPDAPVSEAFVALVVRGAGLSRLPEAYVAQLQAEALILEAVQRFGREQLGVGR